MGQMSDCLQNRQSEADDPAPSTTAELEPYIKAALLQVYGESPTSIFLPTPTSSGPHLRKGVANRILLYRGSFNPPHIGHKTLLTHTFFRTDLTNVIAALIIPTPTVDVSRKLRRETNPIVLSRVERGALWQHDLLMQWAWVHTYSRSFRTMRKALTQQAAQDGFELEFFMVAGGENAIRYGEKLSESESEMPDLIFSDAFRQIYIFDESGVPKPLYHYNAWSTTKKGDEQLVQRIRHGSLRASEVLTLLYQDEAQSVQLVSEQPREANEEVQLQHLITCLRDSGISWICRHNYHPQATLQYIPAHNVRNSSIGTKPSSTQIRQALQTSSDDQRLESIADMALNAELLLSLVREQESGLSQAEEQNTLLEG
jgi:hypothetical protein